MSSLGESSSSAERASHSPTKVFKGHTNGVRAVAYFPHGQHIASGCDDKTIRIWSVETGQQEGEALEHDYEVGAIAISPDGRTIAGRVVNRLIIWDVARRKRVRGVKMDGGSEDVLDQLMVAFSPDGRCIATASSASASIRLWDVDTGSSVKELQPHTNAVWYLSFSPDGACIATGSSDGSCQVLDISTGKTVVGPIRGHTDAVISLVYSPDSRLLVTASDDGSIRAWDGATGQEVGSPMLLPMIPIHCIAISADGKRIASASSDKTVGLWNLETRLQVGDPFTSRAFGWTRTVAFSPNGRFIIGGGSPDINLWDTAAVLDSTPSPPTTSNQEPSRSISPSAHVTTHPSPPPPQLKQTPSKQHGDTSSLSPSILDLPAVTQPKPEHLKEVKRAPSIDDWDSFQPHRQPTAEPAGTQQEPRVEPQNLNTPPSASGNQWARIIRRRWRHLRSRKPRAHVEMPQDSPHSPPKEHPTLRKHPDPGPATDPSAIPTHSDSTGDGALMGDIDTQKQPRMRFWNRLRRSGAPRDESGARGQKQPTPGVIDVAGGRDKRLVMSSDTEEYGVPLEPVELPPIASRPPSFFEIEEDPLKGWSWSRELCELICCYWCFPRNTRPV
ncbi:WD40 repeat-like protein [Leucogyrophana mollusca]|uniref:WD40 repeat-like protein n=1 Tax=Leucogyrophana mollusca TaxID=85980 RepID=A0ACB8BH74_9AGAM|nr:WD40 repeat-like protein [Leucogyrophana mollusca]